MSDAGDPACVRFGREVSERLVAVPGIFRIGVETIDMFLLRNFLTVEECAGLIERIDAKRQPSQVLAYIDDPNYRTSDSCNLDRLDPFVQLVEAKLTALTGIDPRHGETIQGQRYGPGQQFKPHHDFFHVDQPYWEAQNRIGGQRTWTAMIFLNRPEAGGHTYFPKADVEVIPVPCNLLAWNNLDAAGEPNVFSMHQGTPVGAGVKYIITKWYRERPWGAPAPA